MAKTVQEKQEHLEKAMLINNELGKEYGRWFGWPEHSPIGRYQALGEYIVELCENEPHLDWLDAAKDAYLKDKKKCGWDMTPPRTMSSKTN